MVTIRTDRPLERAVEQITRKVPVGLPLSSEQISLLPAEIRDRAMISARVEDERILAEMQQRLQARIELERSSGRTMERGPFVEEMREIVRKSGYRRPDGVKRGSLQDLKSSRRLSLIFSMNLAQAQGYARWAADMTEEGLENEPCYELVRISQRMETRNWPRIWAAVGGKFYGGPGSNPDYPGAAGRMIAPKTDPIWVMISRFETPWPPFDWGSGMGLRGIARFEAEALGVIDEDDEFRPQARPFNEGHRMSARQLPESARDRLRNAFGDSIRFEDNDIVITRELTSESMEQRKRSIADSLAEREREYRELAAAEKLSEEVAETLAKVAVGRQRLFAEAMSETDESNLTAALKDTPDALKIQRRDALLLAWRSDLEGDDISPLLAILKRQKPIKEVTP